MTKKQKVGYVLNEWMVAWLLFYGLLVFVMVVIGSDHATTFTDYLVEVTIILAVAAVMFGPIALAKWLTIRRSKQRTFVAETTAAHASDNISSQW